ncbi:spidroin-1-like [Bubalus kerabau]|uniref:spidroin-1-like n=1 Tax=Bubalus carabanensis TaxID=3119969 RepID=UPI00244EE8EA|nr:spidroin-1-like [Bubalus carabanensis]
MVVPGTNRLPPIVYGHHNRKECPDVGLNGLNMVLPTRVRRFGQGRPGRGQESTEGRAEGGQGGRREAEEEGGGRFYCFLSPSSSRASPRRHWKAARAARRRVIYSAGCARVTEPGPTDGAADALGRGAESAGLRVGRRRQWGSVCAAAVAAGGRGRRAGSRSPTPLPLARDPPKGALAGRGRPLCASRGAGPAQGAPSGGRGDRGAGSAGQVTYPGPGAGALFGSGEGRGAGVGVDAGQPFWDSCLPSTPRSPPRWPARRKPTWVCGARSERETSA